MKWDRHRKNEFLKHIQINPLSISPAGLSDYTYGESVIEIPGLVKRREENKEFNKVEFEKRLEKKGILYSKTMITTVKVKLVSRFIATFPSSSLLIHTLMELVLFPYLDLEASQSC